LTTDAALVNPSLARFDVALGYLLPAKIAGNRAHPSRVWILTLNFFFGWTFVAWLALLAWALTYNSRSIVSSVIPADGSPSKPPPFGSEIKAVPAPTD
jgi:hypothetical protein